MRSHARVVIVHGIIGVGLLYHFPREGWTDSVLIEKGELTSGSTWHAAGQGPHFNSSLDITKVHVYGHHLGGVVALGYVREGDRLVTERNAAGAFEIEVAGRRVPATASLTPLYGPKNTPIRA
jgi:glycine cleavage system aminomethyltransferase T